VIAKKLSFYFHHPQTVVLHEATADTHVSGMHKWGTMLIVAHLNDIYWNNMKHRTYWLIYKSCSGREVRCQGAVNSPKMSSRTGAKLFRCSGVTPCSRSAARWAGVP
jgi:hypothetical protein